MKYYKYSYKEKIIPIVFVLLIVIVLFLPLEISSPNGLLIDIPLLILMFILHEVLHAVGFRFLGRAKSKNITYGVNLEKGVFYCTCKEEISKKGILISLCLPFIIISLIGGILGIIFSINTLIFLAFYNFFGACFDILAFIDILRLPSDIKYKDLDDEMGFILISKNDLPKNLISIDLKEKGVYNKDSIKAKDYSKIKITNFSKIILIIIFILLILGIVI